MNRRSVAGLFVGALVIGIVVWVSDPASLAQVKDVRPVPALAVFVMSCPIALTASWRWKLVLHALQPGVVYPLPSLFRVVVLGLTAGIVVNQDVGLAAARITYLSRGRKMTIERASFSVFMDRWFDVVVLVVVAPISGLFALEILGLEYSLAIIIILVTTLLVASLAWTTAAASLFTVAFEAGASIVRRLLRRGWLGVPETRDEPFQTLTRLQLFYVLVLSLGRMMIVGVSTWLVVTALGIDLPFATVFLLVPFAQLTLLIPFIPGGLGSYDAGWYGILLLQGVSAGDSLSFIVTHRVLVTLALLLMAAFTEIAWQLNKWLGRPAPSSSPEEL